MYELVGLYSVDLRIKLITKLTKKQVNNMQEVRRSRTSFSISCGVKALSKKIKKSQKFTTTSPPSGTQSFQISLFISSLVIILLKSFFSLLKHPKLGQFNSQFFSFCQPHGSLSAFASQWQPSIASKESTSQQNDWGFFTSTPPYLPLSELSSSTCSTLFSDMTCFSASD